MTLPLDLPSINLTAVVRVEATGVASASTTSGNTGLASQIEAAMMTAVRQCLDEGITDPGTQRERIIAAREAVLAG